MSQEQILKRERFREVYELWTNDQCLVLSAQQKQEVYDLIKEVDKDYHVDLWCGHCVAGMLEYLFRLN